MDEEQQWLINCLNATLDTDQKVRSFAETSLHQASLQSGFGIALSSVAANRDLSLGLRQLAAVLLKQFIKKLWNEDEESFEQFTEIPSTRGAKLHFLTSCYFSKKGKDGAKFDLHLC